QIPFHNQYVSNCFAVEIIMSLFCKETQLLQSGYKTWEVTTFSGTSFSSRFTAFRAWGISGRSASAGQSRLFLFYLLVSPLACLQNGSEAKNVPPPQWERAKNTLPLNTLRRE
ncbi:MAG: hypothetical protein ACQEQV_07755, partial [Fibrobacterota bacterium]